MKTITLESDADGLRQLAVALAQREFDLKGRITNMRNLLDKKVQDRPVINGPERDGVEEQLARCEKNLALVETLLSQVQQQRDIGGAS
jgi:hypothetical protein